MGLLLFLYRLAPSAVFLRRLRRNFLVERCFSHAIKEVISEFLQLFIGTSARTLQLFQHWHRKQNFCYYSRPGEIGHDYKGLPRVPHPALHSDGIVSADPGSLDTDMTGPGLSKTSFTDR